MENKTGIFIENLQFTYSKEKEILHRINLDFKKGEITAIIGANGCGKSTLLNLIAGVLTPLSGVISLDGKDIRKYKKTEFAKRVSAVHQKNTAPPDMTVEQLVRMGRTPYRRLLKQNNAAKDDFAVAQAMRYANVEEYADLEMGSLSGGMLQRVWLAMALAQETDILLLDEITTYLDIHYQLEILNLIYTLNRKKRNTVIMVLHDINLVMQYCDNIILMKEGFILYDGKTDRLPLQQLLDEAFCVKTKQFLHDGKKYYFFSAKESENR